MDNCSSTYFREPEESELEMSKTAYKGKRKFFLNKLEDERKIKNVFFWPLFLLLSRHD